ncbi:MAG: proline dehydrogenase family protein [Chitinophagaceae bacterium]|nr:proline dehydrogenase family protein [Chitinophagaceae bacterium]
MNEQNRISFDNTECAFAAKSNAELKKAKFLFGIMGKAWLVNLALKITPVAIKWQIPFTKTLIRQTIFKQFVGGETLAQTARVADKLEKYNVQVILDYGVEGKEGEASFEQACTEFLNVIDYAATQPNIPFMSVKVTGFARFSLLEKMDDLMSKAAGTLMKRYLYAVDALPEEEKQEWQKIKSRIQLLCEEGNKKNIGVLIDAEETWIQDPVDALTILMMDVFNKEKLVIYNTLQLYRHDRYQFLKDSYAAAVERNFILGVKLVRGAYMEKERNRADELNDPSPIQPDKASCDRDYNASVEYCIEHIDKIAVIVASHNEYSNLYTTELLDKKGLPHNHPHVHFSQLYGMSDNITFNLAKSNCSVSKYLPFGPIQDVVPYLMRRAQENSSVSGQTGKELVLIEKELQRRKI